MLAEGQYSMERAAGMCYKWLPVWIAAYIWNHIVHLILTGAHEEQALPSLTWERGSDHRHYAESENT